MANGLRHASGPVLQSNHYINTSYLEVRQPRLPFNRFEVLLKSNDNCFRQHLDKKKDTLCRMKQRKKKVVLKGANVISEILEECNWVRFELF